MVKQVKDDSGAIVPLLGYRPGGAIQLNYTTTSANTTTVDSKIVSITPTTNCFIEFNGVASNTTSHFLLGGVCYDMSIGAERGAANLSVIGDTVSGKLYISERS